MDSFDQLEARLRESLLQLLWDQWVALGMAGGATRKPVPFIIDPEALLLATTRFARDEPRLANEVLDWLVLNGKSISIARLKNLQLNFQFADRAVLAAIAEFITESHHKSWKALTAHRNATETPLALSKLFGGKTPELRGLSTRPDAGAPENFLFKMRALFGVSARAEILAWLLTHPKGHPAAIARETAWFSKTVQLVLNELERSGHVHSRQRGREKSFSLHPGDWSHFTPMPGTPVGWVPQGGFYGACAAMLEALSAAKRVADNERLVSIELHPWLRSITALLDPIGELSEPFARLDTLRGGELAEAFGEALAEFIEQRVDGRALVMNPFRDGGKDIDASFYQADVGRETFT